MDPDEWRKLILTIPKNFNYEQAAKHIGQSYHRTRDWMIRFGRKAPRKINGQLKFTKTAWRKVDWTLRDIDIARILRNPKTGKPMTRERVRQVRRLLGKLKVGRCGPPPKILVDTVN